MEKDAKKHIIELKNSIIPTSTKRNSVLPTSTVLVSASMVSTVPLRIQSLRYQWS